MQHDNQKGPDEAPGPRPDQLQQQNWAESLGHVNLVFLFF